MTTFFYEISPFFQWKSFTRMDKRSCGKCTCESQVVTDSMKFVNVTFTQVFEHFTLMILDIISNNTTSTIDDHLGILRVFLQCNLFVLCSLYPQPSPHIFKFSIICKRVHDGDIYVESVYEY